MEFAESFARLDFKERLDSDISFVWFVAAGDTSGADEKGETLSSKTYLALKARHCDMC